MGPFLTIQDIGKFTSYEFETVCRTYACFAPLHDQVGVARVLSRYKMFVDVTDISLVPHLILDGFWETPVTQCLTKIVREGDVCIDIGAHLGYFSILMSALAGDRGKTYSIEPNPRIASLLHKTSTINHPGFFVWEGAVSNQAGTLEIFVPQEKSGDASMLIRAPEDVSALTAYRVNCLPLDQFLKELAVSRVDVIKMDAEGAEPFIFEGMDETLKFNKDLKIVMEYSPHLYTDIERFNRFLVDRFEVYRIHSGFVLDRIDLVELQTYQSRKSHVDLLLLPIGYQFPEEISN